MTKKILAIAILVLSLSWLFLLQEELSSRQPPFLRQALPAWSQRALLGYLHQVAAEFQFVRANVFIGTVLPRGDYSRAKYAEGLSHNFKVMTALYPQFMDPYFVCQANIPDVSPQYAAMANDILLRGAKARPDNIILPFFAGFNSFYYLHDNERAASIFLDLAQRKNAPLWLGHLAALLAAKDGDLYGGLMALQVMLQTAEEEKEKKMYRNDIAIFQGAIQVAEASAAFERQYGHPPASLKELVPTFLPGLPDTGTLFELTWDGHSVRLVRPGAQDKTRRSFEKALADALYIEHLSLPYEYRTSRHGVLPWPAPANGTSARH